MKIVSVRFSNYHRSYAFNTSLPLKEGHKYKIIADGAKYFASILVDEYLEVAPVGITLKEITDAEEVVEDSEY